MADYFRKPDYADYAFKLLMGVFIPAAFFLLFLGLYKSARRKKLSFALGYTITYTVVSYCCFAMVSLVILFFPK
ncbi:hypothetical protein GCM10011396_03790 [Undibacterium terreum]|uniref:Uncharacterized protein n=1 Tax=Undibacterium terreum TaxID=1224302 RepID=A0A916XBQ7_9BURK|nr:hypothetical protein GCM10011396_03790 [Undibacterium terreum]